MAQRPAGVGASPCHQPPGAPRAGGPWRVALILAAWTSAAACPQPAPLPPPAPPTPPQVTRLEVVPNRVQVEGGAAFSLDSRAFDERGYLVKASTARPVVWTTPASGTVVLTSQSGNEAWFKAAAVPAQELPVRAAMEMGKAPAAVTVHVPTADADPTDVADWIVAPHQPSGPVSLALVRGSRGGVAVRDDVVALAGMGRMDNLDAPGSLALFSAGRRAAYAEVAWTADADTVFPTPGPAWAVPLRVWDATGPGLGAGFLDLSIANLVFRGNRTGAEFTLPDGVIRLPPTSASTADCAQPELLFGSSFNPGVRELHVFYVASITEGWTGFACPEDSDPTRLARLVILQGIRNATTLAHELGHVLSLTATQGHTDCLPGFAEDNLMWRFLPDDREVNRLQLSLGQVYRIAMDQQSWLVRLGFGAAPVAPRCDDPSQPCPQLALAASPLLPVTPPTYCGTP